MSDVLTEALAAAQRRGEELLTILERWVKTNSCTSDPQAVNAMGELLGGDLDFASLTLERRPGSEFGDHLAWTTPAWHQRPSERLLLLGHHDTVFPAGTFEVWERDGGRLRGPGVYDMKGGLAVVRTALAALDDAGVLADTPVALVSVADEELGSPESRAFVEDIARGAGAGLVFEGGRAGDAIITMRKGTGKFKVVVKGKAAHAGNQHAEGINAIRALARFVDRIEDLTDYQRGVTVNVGIFNGGVSANTVCDRAEAMVDFRFERARDGEDLVAAIDKVGREIAGATAAKFSLTGGIRRLPLERSEASGRLYQRYAECAEAAGLAGPECPLIGGGSDANTTSAIGVPTVDGMGPRGANFHTDAEYIEVESLALKVDALVRFLIGWRQQPHITP
jgi:glutamate carboxypeptidase